MDNSPTPRVLVVMAAYNAEGTISAAIGSVQNQTYENWELAVVDDSSTDNTGQIVRALSLVEKRISYHRNENKPGAAGARNQAWRNSAAEFVAVLDADDTWMPTHLQKQVQVMLDHPEISVVGTGAILVDSSGTQVGVHLPCETNDQLCAEIMRKCPFVHSTVLMRRSFLEALGGYDERLLRGQDYDLWIRGHRKFRYQNIAEPLVKYRVQEKMSWLSLRTGTMLTLKAGLIAHRPLQGVWYSLRYLTAGLLRLAHIIPPWRGRASAA